MPSEVEEFLATGPTDKALSPSTKSRSTPRCVQGIDGKSGDASRRPRARCAEIGKIVVVQHALRPTLLALATSNFAAANMISGPAPVGSRRLPDVTARTQDSSNGDKASRAKKPRRRRDDEREDELVNATTKVMSKKDTPHWVTLEGAYSCKTMRQTTKAQKVPPSTEWKCGGVAGL